MKAVSLWQPWASLVACGRKRIETRGWPTMHRGPLLIHATAKEPKWIAGHFKIEPVLRALVAELIGDSWADDPAAWKQLPRGKILARVRVEDVVRVERIRASLGPLEFAQGDYSSSRWAWRLGDLVELATPISCRGAQGLWTPPAEVVRELTSLGAAA